MAFNTINTYLMYKTEGGEWTKLADITSVPDLDGTVETVDVTTLSDASRKYIKGVTDPATYEFESLFDPQVYSFIREELSKVKGTYQVLFGQDGEEGIFEFEAAISVRSNAAAVSEARMMTITLIPGSEILFTIGQ